MTLLVALLSLRWAAIVLPADAADQELAQNLSDVLVATIADRTHASLVGREELGAELGLSSDRGVLGCAGDTACLGRVGVALKVEKMVVGTVSRGVGDEYVLNLNLVDVGQLKTERGELRKAKGIEALVRELQSIAISFTEPASVSPPSRAPTPTAAPEAAKAPPLGLVQTTRPARFRTAAWVSTLSGAALLGLGLTTSLLARSKASELEQWAAEHRLYDQAARDLESDGSRYETLSYVFWSTGAAAAIAGGLLFYLGRPVTITSDGRTLSLAGRF